MMQKHYQKACDSIAAQTLYVVATPIGNLADITLRALAVLHRADIICAEDTRVTAQLLSAYGIQAKLVSVREHNEQQMAGKIIDALSDGLIVAQVSDAGTPAVCDPGAKLAARVREAGFRVVPVVGASAVMGALSVAGVTEPNFYFNGFLPAKAGERQKLLASWADADFPVVMFETPHRIEATLSNMASLFPERRLMLAREISKTFETFLTGSVVDIQTALKNDSNQSRGEMVLVLHPAIHEKHSELPDSAQKVMKVLAAELPTKQAADLAAKITGESKKALYDLALTWK
ncbi:MULTISPECIES: 16S rRNA (cytidine(1402)-2'-O)-methyltransferase [unclassified Neisseria]|uniref:16S rRNA (cytidine(1402)-2'-O)-methyltransferase n=1 Tax=unclassified Neisseria TaxID=2623750 RepID=UPI0026665D86|nr:MULTISPECIES: 16S rRNA (cytidine(1402)-2'-O)-methyltransferase [unclassified Neisseria]MDO1510995.1 16S rRNA (cytidine(1402)-2'-O)-methyltransferase [Neisseria sp. MVDL19-042950]MDO1517254.1 16S rRNA (cytidine(1402)-2'-O)-methyltransferase [Neisseria sp. MVDL18-041461]MDO1564617.1 16S rRNA (cytidine(1402)-2'-O)-methyltransferase [Neisseria sp. MVDL20-010259]